MHGTGRCRGLAADQFGLEHDLLGTVPVPVRLFVVDQVIGARSRDASSLRMPAVTDNPDSTAGYFAPWTIRSLRDG